jgi:nicotinic acid mononucleotide adenylyltransferase
MDATDPLIQAILQELQTGQRPRARIPLKPQAHLSSPTPLVFPGSFHPVHEGHLAVGRIAAALLNTPIEFEIAARNVDKPSLDAADLLSRIEALRAATAADPAFAHLSITNAPTFLEKARIFPAATFVLGLDTLDRIVDPGYYPSSSVLYSALDELAALDAHFVVFFRQFPTRIPWNQPESLPAALRDRVRFMDRNLYSDIHALASRKIREHSSTEHRP